MRSVATATEHSGASNSAIQSSNRSDLAIFGLESSDFDEISHADTF